MNQITVETSGSFMLIDRTFGHTEIAPVGPTTVRFSPFIERKLREGMLKRVEAEEGEPLPPVETPQPKAAKGRRSK